MGVDIFQNYNFLFDSQYSVDLPQEAIFQCFLDEFSAYKSRKDYFLKETAESMIIGKVLKWDSLHFGFPMASLKYLVGNSSDFKYLLDSFEIWLSKNNIKYLSCRCNLNEFDLINALHDEGFETVTNKLMLRLKENYKCERNEYINIRPLIDSDVNQILTIIEKKFKLTRFHKDSAFKNNLASSVYVKWFMHLNKNKTASVLVSKIDSKIDGFVMYTDGIDLYKSLGKKFHHGFISLIATLENDKIKGVGKSLLSAAIKDMIERKGLQVIYANTDSRNIPSIMMFQKTGFHVFAGLIELRKWYGNN
jgi:ribosomal protein S18 acetylase RimI-like enzyme